jgi:hypothetical protein
MNVLFVGRSVYHFTYYESLVRQLCAAGHSVEMIYDEKWSHGQSDESLKKCINEHDNLALSWGLRRSDKYRRLLFAARELRSYSSYLHRTLSDAQSEFYLKRWRNYLTPFVRYSADKWPLKSILATNSAQSFLGAVENFVPPDKKIIRSLSEKKPDIVIASPVNMRFSEEVEYIKAAKAIGIPTAILVLSWDNLTTKGLFAIVPDLLLVWNQAHFEEALGVHKMPRSNAVIVGSPFFDKWFDSDHLLMEQQEFCERLGLDPSKPFVTYLGSSANIARDETWLVEQIVNGVRQHPDRSVRKVNFVVRPHPANAGVYERIHEPGVVVWPKDGALPESETSQRDFFNTLRYCVGTLGINTSGMIDAIILNKPCVSIITEEYSTTQSQAVHFKHLLASGAVEAVDSVDGSLKAIERMLSGVDDREGYRKRFVASFVRPYDITISAGRAAARAVELAAQKMRPERIKQALQQEFSETK